MAYRRQDQEQEALKAYDKYVTAKEDLKRSMSNGLRIFVIVVLYSIPQLIWISIISLLIESVDAKFLWVPGIGFFFMPVIFDICLYIHWRLLPISKSDREDDDTNPPREKYIPPIISTLVWIIFLFVAIFSFGGETEGVFGFFLSAIAIIYGIYERHSVPGLSATADDIKEHYYKNNPDAETLADRMRRLYSFYTENKDRTEGKYVYVYCIGSVEYILKINVSYAIYKVPEQFYDLARCKNVAVGKRFFKSTKDSDMIICKVFRSDENCVDAPLLTSIRKPKRVYYSACYERPKVYIPQKLSPIELTVEELDHSVFNQCNVYDSYVDGVNNYRKLEVYGRSHEIACIVPNDLPMERIQLGSIVEIENKKGDNMLCKVCGIKSYDKEKRDIKKEGRNKEEDSIEERMVDSLIKAYNTEDEEEREKYFKDAFYIHDAFKSSFKPIKALYIF